jgi:DNA-binding transcriptional ArsR family regulator
LADSEKITFKVHLPMELLYSLYALGTEKHFYKMIKDFNLEPNDEIVEAVKTLKSGLSSYMKQELNYFYELPGIGYILYQYILLHEDITDIQMLLKVFRQYDANDLVLRVVNSVSKSNFPEENTKEYKELQENLDAMIEIVEHTEFQDPDRQERVMECIRNPEETKQRLSFFLEQYYQRCFHLIEENLTKLLEAQKEKYRKLYQSNPKKFIEQYLSLNSKEDALPIVCISFFKYISWHTYSLEEKESRDWFVLGVYSDLLYEENLCYERFSNFFNTLSDPNRIAILKMLSEKPCYGQELAEKLDITPATVSYHMTFLQRAGVITVQRSDNRSYYSMNCSKLMKPLEDFMKFFGFYA